MKAEPKTPRLGIQLTITEDDLVSDESGLIVAVHRPRGFEYGGTCQHFLVVFRKCDEVPTYDFLITADGYQPIKFPDKVFYELDYTLDAIGTTTVILDTGYEHEIPIFE